jgi:hypothetical protein
MPTETKNSTAKASPGPQKDPGKQIAEEWRYAQALRYRRKHECQNQARHDRRDEGRVMWQ